MKISQLSKSYIEWVRHGSKEDEGEEQGPSLLGAASAAAQAEETEDENVPTSSNKTPDELKIE